MPCVVAPWEWIGVVTLLALAPSCSGTHGAHDAGHGQDATVADSQVCESWCGVPDLDAPYFGAARECGIDNCGQECLPGCGPNSTCNSHDRCMRVQPAEGDRFVQIVAGRVQTCGLTESGSVACWPETPSEVPPQDGKYRALAASHTSLCAIGVDDSVICWGSSEEPEAWSGRGIRRLVIGYADSCAEVQNNLWECTGTWDEQRGELPAPDNMHFTEVVAGLGHYCGLREDGTAACWGDNGYGQAEAPGVTFSSLAGGAEGLHSCGVQTDGVTVCWASRGGDAGLDEVLAPPTDARFESIALGHYQSCGIDREGNQQCWGEGSSEDAPTIGPFAATTLGASHGCALRLDGSAVCWGVPDAESDGRNWE